MRTRRELTAVARALVGELGLTRPLDVDLLRERLATKRGRPIDLVATDLMHHSTFGFTGGDETADVIMYEKRTAGAHQTLIVLHELAHLILGHPRRPIDHGHSMLQTEEFETISPEVLAELFGQRRPTRWTAKWRRVKRRHPTLYDDANEWEAEVLATILLSWTSVGRPSGWSRPNDHLEAILAASPW